MRPPNPNTTEKEQAVLDYVVEYYEEEGIPPTMREITEAFNYAHPSAAYYFLKTLEKKGFLRKARGRGGYLPV